MGNRGVCLLLYLDGQLLYLIIQLATNDLILVIYNIQSTISPLCSGTWPLIYLLMTPFRCHPPQTCVFMFHLRVTTILLTDLLLLMFGILDVSFYSHSVVWICVSPDIQFHSPGTHEELSEKQIL